MENASADQIALISSLGVLGISVVVAFVVLGTLLGAWMLNISLGIVGNRKPGVLACVGWMFAIGIVNMLVSTMLTAVAGPFGVLLMIPGTLFVTAYMLSMAGECSVLQGFLSHLLSSFMSAGVGVILALAVFIPLGMLSKGDNAFGREIRKIGERFEKAAEEQRANSGDAFDFDMEKFNNVSLPSSAENEAEPSETKASKFSLPFLKSSTESESEPSSEEFQPKPTKRAADGTQLNPFFGE